MTVTSRSVTTASERGGARSRWLAVLRVSAAVSAAAAIALLLGVAVGRIGYPFELEWMEGATLDQVRRVRAGLPLYVAPTLDFVPFAYPPLYYYASATVSLLTGVSFLPLRIVSLASTVACLVVLFAMVRIAGSRWAALVATGLFAATYQLSGAWLDIGRVDAMYLALALGACALLLRASTPRGHLVAAACAVLAFLAKQPIAVVLAPAALFLLIHRGRAFLWFLVPAALAAGLLVFAADQASSGWFRYYVFTIPRLRMRMALDWDRNSLFWIGDLVRPLAPVLAFSVVLAGRRLWREQKAAVFVAAGLIGSSWLARLEGGAWSNALLPAYAGIALLFGLSVARATTRIAALGAGAAIVQMGLLAYDPRPLIPTAADARAGYQAVEAIRRIPGEVLVLDHGYLGGMAGKQTYAHGWAMTDVMWADYAGNGARLEASAAARIARREFSAIVVDDVPHWFTPAVEGNYPVKSVLFPGPEAFWPVSGSRRRPAHVLTARR